MAEHTHTWIRGTRRHKNPGRIFVVCKICNIQRQATIKHGHIHVFHTGTDRGGGSVVKTYRLKPWQQSILDRRRLSFVQFVDECFKRDQ